MQKTTCENARQKHAAAQAKSLRKAQKVRNLENGVVGKKRKTTTNSDIIKLRRDENIDLEDEINDNEEGEQDIIANMDPFYEGEGAEDAAPEGDEAWNFVDCPLSQPPLGDRTGINCTKNHMPRYTGAARGVRNIPANCHSKKDFFTLLFNEDICSTFIDNTNGHINDSYDGKQRKGSCLLDALLFFKFIAIIIYMGISRLPSQRMYWEKNSKFSSSWAGNVMSRSKFLFIWSHLHWTNTFNMTPNEKHTHSLQNGFWQVSKFLVKLSVNFALYYQPGQCMDIDEMCIWFKGRHRCRCYNPNKPEKWHFKAFCLNCSETGYVHRFYMYEGASEQRPQLNGKTVSATFYPTVKLLSPIEYYDCNHIISTDNWFTQFESAAFCRSHGIHFNGTIKTNRKGVPRAGIFPYKGANMKQRGDMKCMVAKNNEHNYYFTAWMDSKPVHILSTYLGYFKQVARKTKDAAGAFIRVLINRPTVIADYNKGMGGTDQGDQLASYYRYEHRTVRWPHRIFTHFVMTTAVNAHILYREHHKLENLTLLMFLDGLMDELIVDNCDDIAPQPQEPEPVEQPKKHNRVSSLSGDNIRLVSTHTMCKVKGVQRRCMAGCTREIGTKCVQCDQFLCLNYEGEPSCWDIFHSSPILK
jgi:hypothetical protein